MFDKTRLKYIYIFSLLVIFLLLLFIVQNVFQKGGDFNSPVEFKRVDVYDSQLGKISRVSVRLYNDGAAANNYTIDVFIDSKFFVSNTSDVPPKSASFFSIDIPIEKEYTNGTIVERRLHNASFSVYPGESAEPVDTVTFNFD